MAIKRIFSAGGIIIRPKGYDPVSEVDETGSGENDGKWEVLVTQHSKHKGWDFPKGHLEVAESSQQAAKREVEEEVGIKAEILEKAGQTQYFYWDEGEPHSAEASRGKQKVLKTVNYFLMKYLGEGKATTAFEVSAKKWLPVDEVEEQLTFKTTKEMWRDVRKRIEQLTI